VQHLTSTGGGDPLVPVGQERPDAPSRSPAGEGRPRRPWLGPVLVFVGLLAVQLAWIGSLPAFRGIDEHDHVYRADSVAGGDWVSSGETTDQGRGELLSVRRSIIEAAGPICDAWPYTERYNCHAYAPDGTDRAYVASAAARYHPAFYWMIGTAAERFDGNRAVYAMRAASATMCALLVALAFAALHHVPRAPWRLAALLVVLTPMMTYSTALAAPNGMEMSAALLAWASLLALTGRWQISDAVPSWLVACTAAGLAVLATMRSLGPLWAVLIVVAVAALVPQERLRPLVTQHRRPLMVIGGVWITASVLGAVWTLVSGTNNPRSEGVSLDGSAWSKLPRQFMLWTLQSIGAFPARDTQAPVIVYALFIVAAVGLLWLGLREAGARSRRVALGILVTVTLVSAGITIVTYPMVGLAWQGRYIWPLTMGVPLVAGLAVTRLSGRRVWLLLITGLVTAATAISQVSVFARERDNPAVGDSWTFLPAVALVVLTVAGFALMVVADLYAGPVDREHPTNDLV
jgi:hypothetical protein